MPARFSRAQKLQVVVDDDDGVVHYHSERHYQHRESYRVKLYSERIEQSERYEYRYRNCRCGDESHPHGQQEHDDDYHGDDCYEQLFKEVGHAVANNLALVGDAVDADICRKGLLEACHHLVDVVAHLDDILSFLHLYAKKYALCAVVRDVRIRLGILPAHVGNVLQAYVVAVGSCEDNHLLDVIYRVERLLHIERLHVAVGLYAASGSGEALLHEFEHERLVAQSVVAQALVVKIYGYLFFLHAAYCHASYALDAAQAVLQTVHIVLKFAVSLVLALHRYEQGGGVSEVVHHLDGEHVARQLRLEVGHAVLELAPELVLVVHVVVEFHLYVGYSVAAFREGLGLLHLFVSEDVVLQWLCYLLGHLVRRHAGGYRHDYALAHGEVGKLVFPHARQAVYAEGYEAAEYEDDYLPVVHRPFNEVAFVCFHCFVF